MGSGRKICIVSYGTKTTKAVVKEFKSPMNHCHVTHRLGTEWENRNCAKTNWTTFASESTEVFVWFVCFFFFQICYVTFLGSRKQSLCPQNLFTACLNWKVFTLAALNVTLTILRICCLTSNGDPEIAECLISWLVRGSVYYSVTSLSELVWRLNIGPGLRCDRKHVIVCRFH